MKEVLASPIDCKFPEGKALSKYFFPDSATKKYDRKPVTFQSMADDCSLAYIEVTLKVIGGDSAEYSHYVVPMRSATRGAYILGNPIPISELYLENITAEVDENNLAVFYFFNTEKLGNGIVATLDLQGKQTKKAITWEELPRDIRRKLDTGNVCSTFVPCLNL